MKLIIYIFISSFLFLFVSCNSKQTTEQNSEEKILTIKHNEYKGECIGYCDTDLIFDTTNVLYIKRGWDSNSKQLPEIDTSFQISDSLWNNLISIINIDKIMSLDSLYRTDDSGSWVSEGTITFEIITTRKQKKITFVNRKYLQPLDSLNKKLIEFRREL